MVCYSLAQRGNGLLLVTGCEWFLSVFVFHSTLAPAGAQPDPGCEGMGRGGAGHDGAYWERCCQCSVGSRTAQRECQVGVVPVALHSTSGLLYNQARSRTALVL